MTIKEINESAIPRETLQTNTARQTVCAAFCNFTRTLCYISSYPLD